MAHLILTCFRERESELVLGANLVAVTSAEHRRHRQGLLKNHLQPGAAAGIVESGQCAFTPTPAFPEQRQFDEQCRRPGGELDADSDIATARQRPSERRPHVADMPSIPRNIMFIEQRLDDLVVFEKLGIEDRMAASDAIRFVTLCEFGSGVRARGVEQPICRFVEDVRANQGFCNQARDRVDNVRLVHLRIRRNGAGGPKREVADKN